MLAMSASAAASGKDDQKQKPTMIQGCGYDPQGGANAHAGKGDNPHSRFYVNPDFYNLKSDSALTILTHFQTMQQTTEWSCGCIAVLLALNHLGVSSGQTERSLAEAMHSMTNSHVKGAKPGSATCIADYGTSLEEMYHLLSTIDSLRIVESSFHKNYTRKELVKAGDLYPICDQGNLYPTFATPDTFSVWLTEHIRAGRPVLVEWGDWDGHWVCIIGVDNNGTPNYVGDDTLIFADPYDTSDHWQDGYTITPHERFFYSWKDRAIAPKPYQLQPFIVVERKQ